MSEERNRYGPVTPLGEEIHRIKYRSDGEDFSEAMTRVAAALKDDDKHFRVFRDILLNQKFLPAGRVQTAMGSPKQVTPYNCFVSGTIEDSMEDIMHKLAEAAETLRLGGGIGYDFSTLRPRGANIVSLNSRSSGPISFMGVYDALCRTISSAGHRRGAQMGVLRVDHPDIEEFISAKHNETDLRAFNISIAITDKFMDAVKNDKPFDLVFDGRVYKTIDARALWEKIMRSTWDWSEPGVLFIDRINRKNNLWYCENIAATNPCGEQPLPPYGACLLGSINLTKYVMPGIFLEKQLLLDIPYIVRAMDNVIDRAKYPLERQRLEAISKRRMGIGVTGLANAGEILGKPYASPEFKRWMHSVLTLIRDAVIQASIDLAKEKGPFPLFDDRWLDSEFALSLPKDLRVQILESGIRNSHLLSIAPTGTISLSADNVSSGIEPPYLLEYYRKIIHFDSVDQEAVKDYAYSFYGIEGVTATQLSASDHVDILCIASKYVDSACSKTCNVGPNVTFAEFKDLYMQAYDGGASGCTTFREQGRRAGILTASKDEEVAEREDEVDNFVNDTDGVVEACTYDPITRIKTCED